MSKKNKDRPTYAERVASHKLLEQYATQAEDRGSYQRAVDNKNKKEVAATEATRDLRPKPFDGYHNLGPDQLKKSFDWEKRLNTTKNPRDKNDRDIAKQTRQEIKRIYDKPKIRKYLGEDELELIGRGKKQQIKYELPKTVLPAYVTPIQQTPIPKASDYFKQAVIAPGLSEGFISLNKEIKKNFDYVMGDKKTPTGEKEESHDKTTDKEPN